jgi:hypothetical protein
MVPLGSIAEAKSIRGIQIDHEFQLGPLFAARLRNFRGPSEQAYARPSGGALAPGRPFAA